MKRAVPVFGTLVFAFLSSCAVSGSSAPDPGTSPQDDASLYEWLVSQEVPTDSALRVQAPEPDQYKPQDPGDIRVRVGVAVDVGQPVAFSDIRAGSLGSTPEPLAFGAIRGDGAGGFVWSAVVQTPRASATRLGFQHFSLPTDASMYVYDDFGEVFGPYTGTGIFPDGEFWSNTLLGDTVRVQVRYDGTDTAAALAATRFTLAGVGHYDKHFVPGLHLDRSFCSFNASCVENAECGSDPAVNDAKAAVGQMRWISGAYIYICSGGLLADTINSGTPYFLTAHHCIGSNHDAKNLEVYFEYSVSCGTSTCTGSFDPKPAPVTNGATLLATTRTSDSTLLELKQQAPAGTTGLHWSLADISSSTADLYRISHPMGAPQAYSAQRVDPNSSTCQGLNRGNFIYSTDTYGATEGGSSGSPVVNGAGEVVGQLYGACGTNLNDVCDSTQNWTVDGAFAVSYYAAGYAQWLDPNGGGGCVPTESTETSCNDGLDNDCDGLIDSADPDCSSGGGQCVNPGGYDVGASCDQDSQCCSNKCKGKPGAKTCK